MVRFRLCLLYTHAMNPHYTFWQQTVTAKGSTRTRQRTEISWFLSETKFWANEPTNINFTVLNISRDFYSNETGGRGPLSDSELGHTSGRCRSGDEPSDFKKMWEISWLAEKLSASEGGLCCIDLDCHVQVSLEALLGTGRAFKGCNKINILNEKLLFTTSTNLKLLSQTEEY